MEMPERGITSSRARFDFRHKNIHRPAEDFQRGVVLYIPICHNSRKPKADRHFIAAKRNGLR